MSMTPARFRQRLSQAQLPQVTLLAGSEALLVQEAADALRARARELGYSEREVLDVDASFDWDNLARAGVDMSLFARLRLIDLRLPSGRPGKQGSSALTAWCASPPPDTALLITCGDWSRKHETAWVKAVDKMGCFVPLWPLKLDDLPGWVGARLRSRGLQADSDAVALLVERTEGNLLAAAQEIDKLAVLHGGGRLDVATLESLVGDSARYDVFKLTEAALAGDAARALRILAALRAEGEDLVPMMGWLGSQLELAVRLSEGDFAAQARAEHLWPARQQLFRKALRRGNRDHWLLCVAWLARIDRMIKGRESGDPWIELERLIAAIAIPAEADRWRVA